MAPVGGCQLYGTGTKDAPYCSIGNAIIQANGARPYVHVAPGTYYENLDIRKSVIVVGDAHVSGAAVGYATVMISGSVSVTLRGLTISDARGGPEASGIRCLGSAAPAVKIEDCTILNNDQSGIYGSGCGFNIERTQIVHNQRSGIAVYDGALVLSNSVVAQNGYGGVYVKAGGITAYVYNSTLFGNAPAPGAPEAIGAAMTCRTVIEVVNTLVWGHAGARLEGDCRFSHSNVEFGAPGVEVTSMDPRFVSAGDYHLRADSPCRDRGTLLGTPSLRSTRLDIDLQPRVQGNAIDIGADEVP